jgi:GT2 family glycosyltransferase
MTPGYCIAAGAVVTGSVPGVQLSGTDSLVSILVACCGQLEYTRLCVPSLLRHSRPPYEFLFLDSGSLDGTAEYLAGIADALPVRVEVVPVAHPSSGAQPDGQEILQISGEFVVMLNNDTIVTEGWLERLAIVAACDPKIGLVAPMSNYAPPPLLVEHVPFRLNPDDGPKGQLNQLAAVDRFAHEWAEAHRGQWSDAQRLGGGCVLVKREVLQTLGLFPTRTALGSFDIEALGQRAQAAGYRLAACADAFVYHFGSRQPARA